MLSPSIVRPLAAALLLCSLTCTQSKPTSDSLSIFPKPTETRQVQSLDGVWNFRLTNRSENGFKSRWFITPLDQLDSSYERMPVPASFNDITERREVRDFVGWVWYDRQFFVPSTWNDGSILLRFGSVNYIASVYVNGLFVMNHTGGHLPFQADVTEYVHLDRENHISVAVNNVLTNTTLPQGKVVYKNDSRKPGQMFAESIPQFDFFNYAGIHRSVWLYYVPSNRILDVFVKTTTEDNHKTGVVQYDVIGNVPDGKRFYWKISLLDKAGKPAAKPMSEPSGTFQVADANLWWPFTMNPNPGYLYTLSIKLYDESTDNLVDSLYQKVGIRNITLTNSAFLMNGKPVYFLGFGKHEDMHVRGRSMDQSMIQKDFNLIKWIGSNSFRTSHYPYSEEIMDEADEQGIMVIDEVPAVGLNPYSKPLLDQHLTTIRELIDRDKNRPSVVAWSISNEPVCKPESAAYFAKVSAEARSLDPTKRPITAALASEYNGSKMDNIAPSLDFLMINRYYAWYGDMGYVQVIQGALIRDLRNLYSRFKKLMMFSEYGADTLPGMHTEPSRMFSEDFQSEYLIENHKAFDVLRKDGFLIGEHIWNFADFMTVQGITRVGGNKKGIFTRDREPKTAARLLRCRYWKLSGDLTNPHRAGFSLCPDMIY